MNKGLNQEGGWQNTIKMSNFQSHGRQELLKLFESGIPGGANASLAPPPPIMQVLPQQH